MKKFYGIFIIKNATPFLAFIEKVEGLKLQLRRVVNTLLDRLVL